MEKLTQLFLWHVCDPLETKFTVENICLHILSHTFNTWLETNKQLSASFREALKQVFKSAFIF